jgi:hypothetical protein
MPAAPAVAIAQRALVACHASVEEWSAFVVVSGLP